MKRPILFSAPMVQALLADTKTQTRRALKVQPLDIIPFEGDEAGRKWLGMMTKDRGEIFGCRYGVAGDWLYVRETWAEVGSIDPGLIVYRADYPACVPADYKNIPTADEIVWKPSIHMSRQHSRIMLEITDVRIERLNDISEADARAEGIEQVPCGVPNTKVWKNYTPSNGWTSRVCLAENSYHSLWESINGAGSWAANPWVWVISFKRV